LVKGWAFYLWLNLLHLVEVFKVFRRIKVERKGWK
jgi:hypothetical protein